MDPDETLAAIRRMIELMDKSASARTQRAASDAERLVELVKSLDTWLSHNGRMPRAWQLRLPGTFAAAGAAGETDG